MGASSTASMPPVSFVGMGPALASLSQEDWLFFAASFTLYSITYFGFRARTPGYPRRKGVDDAAKTDDDDGTTPKPVRRCDGWLPSLVCSLGCWIAGLYTYYSGGSVGFSEQWFSEETAVTRATLMHFFAFLVFELTVGAVAYTSQLDMLSGWVHHVIYIWLVVEVLGQKACNSLVFYFGSEFPTFVMALGRLGIYRHDILFGSSFFVTRIFIHLINFIRQVTTFDRKGVSRKYEFLVILSLGLHIHWFYAWCIGQRRRMLRASKKEE